MIRIICIDSDHGAAANVGGPVDTNYKTFDINLPDLEKFLLEAAPGGKSYWIRNVIGVELLPNPQDDVKP